MHVVLAVVVLFVLATGAHAQSYGPPTYSVGDTWTRSTGSDVREAKVVKVEDGGTWFTGGRRDCPTCLSLLDRNLALIRLADAEGKDVDVTSMLFVPLGADWRLFDFPLEVDKAWRFAARAYFKGVQLPYQVNCKVVAYEDVKTPAGTFKAFRVRRDWSFKPIAGGSSEIRWYEESWFAPDVKNVVKYASTGRNAEEWVLQSYSLK